MQTTNKPFFVPSHVSIPFHLNTAANGWRTSTFRIVA